MPHPNSGTRRAITADDLFGITVVSDPQVSPDGRLVAWVESRANKHEDGYRSSVWIAGTDGSRARRLTGEAHRDQFPRWSPDGMSIAFVSNRPSSRTREDDDESEKADAPAGSKASQIWTIRIDGGEAIQRSDHPHDASQPAWSPDGSKVVYVGSDTPGDEDDFEPLTSTGPVADERVVRSINYRGDGKGYLERFSHLWVIDLNTGEELQLTTGDVFDREPAWSPDGSQIAFTSNRSAERARQWNRATIQVVPASGGDVRTLAPEEARFGAPAWSPDGGRIAFLGHLGTNSATNVHIWTIGSDGSGIADHTSEIDLSFSDAGMGDMAGANPEALVWKGEQRVLALASRSGGTHIYEANLETNTVKARTSGPHRFAAFAPVGDDLIALRGGFNVPFELVRLGENDAVSVISHANDALLSDVELIDAQPLDVTAPDGSPIQAWIIPPYGFDEASETAWPMVVQIHGGPHSMYGYSLFHEMQLMAARGFAVLLTNPRGSAGYGEAFMGCTRGVWGEADMPDVIAAVDVACGLPWIDEDRIGVTGGSYGGYLTNWIIGHDNRFKAAVTQRCVSNLHSMIGTSDIGTTFGIYEFDGVPWRDAEKLLGYSPISYVESITTPLLILHSENDLRCPIEQAEQLYSALTYLGRDVAFVRFPKESHDLSRNGTPSRRMARLHHLIGWFEERL